MQKSVRSAMPRRVVPGLSALSRRAAHERCSVQATSANPLKSRWSLVSADFFRQPPREKSLTLLVQPRCSSRFIRLIDVWVISITQVMTDIHANLWQRHAVFVFGAHATVAPPANEHSIWAVSMIPRYPD